MVDKPKILGFMINLLVRIATPIKMGAIGDEVFQPPLLSVYEFDCLFIIPEVLQAF